MTTLYSKQTLGYIIASLVMVAGIGIADYHTGEQLGFSIFYLLPIVWITWKTGYLPGIFISLASALVWLTADISTQKAYAHPIIPYWNAAVRLGFFAIISFILSQLKEALEREKRLARRDPLTGMANRQAFYEMSEREIHRARRENKPLSLGYIDLDNFKYINDTWGHKGGDDLLCEVGKILQKNIRSSDIAARLGGDEFVILIPQTDDKTAQGIMERLNDLLLEKMKECNWPVTFSIGLVTYLTPPKRISEIILKGDNLMYEVKAQGKNNIRHLIIP